MLVYLRDRPAECRQAGHHVALTELRHLEERRPAVVRVWPPPDVPPRFQSPQVRGHRRRRHSEEVGQLGGSDRLERANGARDGEAVRAQLVAAQGGVDEVIRQLPEDEQPKEHISAP